MNILITGGLGYIGSHIAKILKNKAFIIDNKSNSNLNYKKYLPNSKVFIGNLESDIMKSIFKNYKIESVIHLAGVKSATESVTDPLKYYENNIKTSIDLLKMMKEFNVNKLIFSSSATVYCSENKPPFKEDMPTGPINPYGKTKLIIEDMIDDYAKSNSEFKAISLRYFNPIGANYKVGLADQPLGNAQNIIPNLIYSITHRKKFNIYGSDYKTKDGTCIRDYIHVNDLANAHLASIKTLKNIIGHIKINIGLGKGISVLELIKIFEKSNNLKINYQFCPRRVGDVAISYSDNNLSKEILNWQPILNYEEMCRDSWQSYVNKKFSK